MFRASFAAWLVVVLIGIAGCGGDDDGGGTTTGGGTAQNTERVDVSLTDFEIDPSNPRIDGAGRVEFQVKNDGETRHNLEVEGPAGEAVLPSNLDPGQSGTLQVDLSEPGTYVWYCPVGNHRDSGMEGEITVAGGGGGSGTGTGGSGSGDPGPY